MFIYFILHCLHEELKTNVGHWVLHNMLRLKKMLLLWSFCFRNLSLKIVFFKNIIGQVITISLACFWYQHKLNASPLRLSMKCSRHQQRAIPRYFCRYPFSIPSYKHKIPLRQFFCHERGFMCRTPGKNLTTNCYCCILLHVAGY